MEVYNKRERPIFKWILAVVLLLIFGGMLFLVLSGYASYFDDPIRKFIYGLRADWLTAFFKGVTFLANPLTLVVLCAILLVIPKTTLRFGIPVSVATGLGSLVHKGIKQLVMRPRPDDVVPLIQETGYSFPSGHANGGLIFYVFLAFLIGRLLKQNKQGDIANLIYVIAGIIVFLIGVSRVYLGIHYPTDVIAGWCLGGMLVIIFSAIYDAVYPLKYHLGIHESDWSKDGIPAWKRPAKAAKKED